MKRIWLDSYPEGVPARVATYPYRSLVELFAQSCEEYADRPPFASYYAAMGKRAERLRPTAVKRVMPEQQRRASGDG